MRHNTLIVHKFCLGMQFIINILYKQIMFNKKYFIHILNQMETKFPETFRQNFSKIFAIKSEFHTKLYAVFEIYSYENLCPKTENQKQLAIKLS
jgi:hypothetical protein